MTKNPARLSDFEMTPKYNDASALSLALIDFVRADERAAASPYRHAILRLLLRLEAISALKVYRIEVDPLTLVSYEMLMRMSGSPNKAQLHLLNSLVSDEKGIENALRAYRYMQAIEWVSNNVSQNTDLGVSFLWHINCILTGQAKLSTSSPRYRAMPFSDFDLDTAPPDQIADLLDDYCQFANSPLLDPLSQAALLHTQLSVICPFGEYNDELGRVMSHALLRKRNVIRHTIAPLAIGPAKNTRAHRQFFENYLDAQKNQRFTEYINRNEAFKFTSFCSSAAAKLIVACSNTIDSLGTRWCNAIEGCRSNSTTALVLASLLENPIATATSIAHETGRSFSSVNASLKSLKSVKIAEEWGHLDKHQLYRAKDAIDVADLILKQLKILN